MGQVLDNVLALPVGIPIAVLVARTLGYAFNVRKPWSPRASLLLFTSAGLWLVLIAGIGAGENHVPNFGQAPGLLLASLLAGTWWHRQM